MDDETIWALALTQVEFYLLVAMLQLPLPTAPGDPFRDVEEGLVQQRLAKARQSMANRGYLEVQADGSVALDVAVAALVQAAVAPTRTTMVSIAQADGTVMQRSVHWASALIVEQEVESDNRVRLTAVRDVDVLSERIRALLQVGDVRLAPGGEFSLSEEDFAEIQDLILEGETKDCIMRLQAMAVPAEAAIALAGVLDETQCVGCVSNWVQQQGALRLHATVRWLVGRQWGCLLQSDAVDASSQVRFVPASGEQIEHAIVDCLLMSPVR